MQHFKTKKNDLQFTVTNRFCERLRQYCGCYGLNSLNYFAPKLWNMVSSETKYLNSLQKFKALNQKLTPEN